LLELVNDAGDFVVLGFRRVECAIGRLFLFGCEAPVPVAGADLFDVDFAVVGEVLEVVCCFVSMCWAEDLCEA
jgi:hypothetical protein